MSELTTAAKDVLKQEGIVHVIKKTVCYVYRQLRDTRKTCKLVKKWNKKKKSLWKSFDFVFSVTDGFLAPMQVKSEIRKFLLRIGKDKPKTIVEIGTANGGTLFLLTRVAHSQAHIYSVDLPGGAFGGGYHMWRKRLYKKFAKNKQSIHLIRANSHEEKTKQRLKNKLKGKEIDVLFIDGDHSYEGVKQDFELYQDMVKSGGYIGFHDVAKHTPER
ncbi:MAG: class I SAM-dependent methyltransferase, partial [Candidatus Magasanikbacteria bacterium]|nr:class I SAM-dependent methyltransferase [Candidatus Magasanikbacteria bacterium]